MITIEAAKRIKVHKVMCKQSLLTHTRYFHYAKEKQKFVVNDHHEQVTDALEYILRGKLFRCIINIAPRYSKTELAVKNFTTHAFSLNATAKFIHLSYSAELASDNSDAIKDTIKSAEYQELFPEVQISNKTDSKKKWATTAGGGFYATSTGGQVTGFGAGKVDKVLSPDQILAAQIQAEKEALEDEEAFNDFFDTIGEKEEFAGALIIDDPIKPEDADSETKRIRINERFDSTVINRINSRKTPIVVMGQRTHEQDLSGHIMKTYGYTHNLQEALDNPHLWYVLSISVYQYDEDGTKRALWPFKHTLEELERMETAAPISFGRQYDQNPTPKEGLMYGPFRTYEILPVSAKAIRKNYTDTADKGKDFLSSGDYLETETGIYITDVLYTQQKMADTEPLTARQLAVNKTQLARFESNNGGEGFARNVEEQTRILGNKITTFETFHQSNNKEVRIFTNSNLVNNLIHMPHDWETRWPEFAKAVKAHKKAGKNLHDDGPDMLTGMVEFFGLDTLTPASDAVLGAFGVLG